MTKSMGATKLITSAKIVAGSNDRTVFNEAELCELADSIAKNGLAQPPTVRPLPNGTFEIVAGERRIRAMRDVLKWERISCFVREMSDEEASAIMLVENTARKDLNPLDEALAYNTRIEKFGWDVARVATTAGVSVTRVENHLMLLRLADDVQHFIKTGSFPLKFALSLGDLDKNRQRIALKAYSANPGITLIKWREIVKNLRDQQTQEGQLDMFGFELRVQKIAESAPCKGKRAFTGVKANRQLPPVRHAKEDSMSPIFRRFMQDLASAGLQEASDAVGNLYNVFVSRGWVTVTGEPFGQTVNVVEDELHEELL